MTLIQGTHDAAAFAVPVMEKFGPIDTHADPEAMLADEFAPCGCNEGPVCLERVAHVYAA